MGVQYRVWGGCRGWDSVQCEVDAIGCGGVQYGVRGGIVCNVG